MRLVAVVLHFRTPELTIRCLSALVNEGIREITLVDNSADGRASLKAMLNEVGTLRTHGCQIDICKPQQNLGFAAGVNLGIQQLLKRGPAHVLLMNSDAHLLPDALAILQHTIESGADVAEPCIVTATGQPQKRMAYNFWLALIFRSDVAIKSHYPTGACILLDKNLVHPTLFDADFFFYGEDIALGHRLKKEGASVVYARNALVLHTGSGSARNGSLFYEYHIVRGHWLLARKLARHKFEFVLAICGRCITLPARALLRTTRTQRLTPIYGFALATWDMLTGRTRDLTQPPSYKHHPSN